MLRLAPAGCSLALTCEWLANALGRLLWRSGPAGDDRDPTNTGQNVAYTQELLTDPIESVLLISKPYMERRAYATCRKVWPAVDIGFAVEQDVPEDVLAAYERLVACGFTTRIRAVPLG
ncbi:ElyC/SanA/YdcF family protein [Kribbella sp. NPDC048928]|uniref:ElyC/SanA/YdcF family protein n=1 Tax=Kribbella sp. NPDC048928 TaxID=3364111 RepID=UPI003712BA27